MQLAARSPGRLKWFGKEQIISLSGGNITIFLSICHEIWEAFLRFERRREERKKIDPIKVGIDKNVQAVGIYTASTEWYDKITEQPNGDDRQRFISELGTKFRRKLLDDIQMSYPGRNGFSLINNELNANPGIKRFLEDATAYGDLYSVPHTTKTRDRKARTKWYLSPILSPFFQIPESHVKEPLYVTVKDIREWIKESDVFIEGLENLSYEDQSVTINKDRPRKKNKTKKTMPLFRHLD